MSKRTLGAGLTAILAAALTVSCGDSSNPPPPVGSGTLFTFISDMPICDVLAFHVLASGSSQPTLALEIAGTTNRVSVIPFTSAIKLNFLELRDFSTVLNLASISAGSYDQATLIYSSPTLVLYDPTQNPPTRAVTTSLPSTLPSIPIQPHLVIKPPVNGTSQVSALQIDFDLRHSVQLDTSGRPTGVVTPVLTATPIAASANQRFGEGELDDVFGIIDRVDTFSSNGSFVGDIGLQLLQGTGPSLTVNLTSNTVINGIVSCGPPALAGQACTSGVLAKIPTDSFAEVDGYVGTDGNFVANSVEIEDEENPATDANQLAFLGIVLSTTKDSSGNVTQFTFFIRDEEPDAGIPTVPLDSVVVVNPSTSTTYQYSSRSSNFTNLAFDQTQIRPGQELVVHGVFNRPATPTGSTVAPPTTIAPGKIYLKLQTHEGNFSSLVQAAGDDKTGAFMLAPCAMLFNNSPILVVTNTNTKFLNVGGLNELTPQGDLIVKGLLFYDLHGGVLQGNTINNVSVPPGTLVLVAKQVHRVP